MGLLDQPYHLKDLMSPGAKLVGPLAKIILIEKEPKPEKQHGVKRGTFISEVVHAGAITANSTTGFDIVDENQSVIYFSKTAAGK